MKHRIELFTNSDCGNCKIIKMILDQYGVYYIEKNIRINKSYENELVEKSNGLKYVPTLIVDNKIFVNIKPHEMLELIKILNQKSE